MKRWYSEAVLVVILISLNIDANLGKSITRQLEDEGILFFFLSEMTIYKTYTETNATLFLTRRRRILEKIKN